MVDIVTLHNRAAWDREVENGNPATVPIDLKQVSEASRGALSLSMTGVRLLPAHWIESVDGHDVLCLACGGGQQVPLLAAAGAKVTSLENSPRQIERDREVIEGFGLAFRPVLGDMCDLNMFESGSFDFVFVGLGTQFVPNPTAVWAEASRVLRKGGKLIAAIVNPIVYTFDWLDYKGGQMRVVHPLPYSDLTSLSDEERQARFNPQDPIEFGHTLETQLGSIVASGLCIDGFFEDIAPEELSSKYFANYYVLRARKGF